MMKEQGSTMSKTDNFPVPFIEKGSADVCQHERGACHYHTVDRGGICKTGG
jgi:hypothetical protein